MSKKLRDLNFLHLVDALYREGSVSAAARRLDLTQPAASHALNRLRVRFADQLFVRSGTCMTPTPLGERLAQGAARALALIQSDILNEPVFDPRQSARLFNVGMTDMGGTVILPRVMQMLHRLAPGITIQPKITDGVGRFRFARDGRQLFAQPGMQRSDNGFGVFLANTLPHIRRASGWPVPRMP